MERDQASFHQTVFGIDWRWSSFHKYVRMGYYRKDLGEAIEKALPSVPGEPTHAVLLRPKAL